VNTEQCFSEWILLVVGNIIPVLFAEKRTTWIDLAKQRSLFYSLFCGIYAFGSTLACMLQP